MTAVRTRVPSYEPGDLAAQVVALVGAGRFDDAERVLAAAAAGGVRLSAVVAAAAARPRPRSRREMPGAT